MWVLLSCTIFFLLLSPACRDPGLIINCLVRVLTCDYNNLLVIACALSPSLESIPSLFLCVNRKMWPPSRVWLNFDVSLLLLLAANVSLNPGPGVCGLSLGAINARSKWDKNSAFSDFNNCNSIDLLGVTKTWMTTRETSADLIEIPFQVSPSFRNPEHREEGRSGSFHSICPQICLYKSTYSNKFWVYIC